MVTVQFLRGACRSPGQRSSVQWRPPNTLRTTRRPTHPFGRSGVVNSSVPVFPTELGLFNRLRRAVHSDAGSSSQLHIQDELLQNPERVTVQTQYGPITGGRASTGAAAFLGSYLSSFAWSSFTGDIWDPCSCSRLFAELPYALPPGRFEDPQPLPADYRYANKEYLYEAGCEWPQLSL